LAVAAAVSKHNPDKTFEGTILERREDQKDKRIICPHQEKTSKKSIEPIKSRSLRREKR